MALEFGSNLFPRNMTDAISASGTSITGDWEEITRGAARIVAQNSADNTTTTVYTVPADKVLYISWLSCDYFANDINGGAVDLLIEDVILIRLQVNGVAGSQFGHSIELVTPMKLIAGETVKIRSDTADSKGYGSFTGYLFDA